jgi:hypothetical protein
MKTDFRFGLLLILLLLKGVFISAQGPIFSKLYGWKGYEEGIAAFPDGQNGFFLLGNSSAYFTQTSDIWVIKADSNGDFKSHHHYGSSMYEKINYSIKLKNGDYYSVGTSFYNHDQSYDIYLLGLKSDGSVICDKTFGGTDWDFGKSIVQDSDTTLMILGQSQSFGLQNKNYLIKVNLNGDTIFTKVVNSNTDDFGNEIKYFKNHYFLCGYSKSPNSMYKSAFYYIINQVGDSVRRVNVVQNYDTEYNTLIVNPDTSSICGGYYRDSIGGFKDGILTKYKFNGFEEFKRLSGQGKENYICRLIPSKFGGILVSAVSTKFSAGKEDFHSMLLSQDCWYINGTTYGTLSTEIPNQIYQDTLKKNAVLVAGTSNSSLMPITSFYFVRSDSLFLSKPIATVVITGLAHDNQLSDLKVFPNPTSDNLTVELGLEGEVMFEIFDMNGKLGFSESKFVSKSIPVYFDFSEYKTGLYLLRISNNEISKSVKIFKK